MATALSHWATIVKTKGWLPKSDEKLLSTLSDFDLFERLGKHYQLLDETLLASASEMMALTPCSDMPLVDSSILHGDKNADYKTHQCPIIFEDNHAIGIAVSNPFNPKIQDVKKRKKSLYLFGVNRTLLNDISSGADAVVDEVPSLLQHTLENAAEKNASDIHLFTEKSQTRVMYRISGTLYPVSTLNQRETKTLINLVKYNAKMDMSSTSIPQDGRLSFRCNQNTLDVRVSVLPTVYGEDVVLRLLKSENHYTSFEDLGFLPSLIPKMTSMLSAQNGLILVTGATGSGKTSTLYTALQWLVKHRNATIISLEDPVEAIISGVRQSQINTAAGYDFKTGLKSVLRQDPDVIMVGEIRDRETASIALEAAYTGHLVLASMHTNDAVSTLTRLSSFGCDPFLVDHSLNGIISQKLRPKVCTSCVSSRTSDCQLCFGTGLHGRTVLSEFIASDALEHGGRISLRRALEQPKRLHSFDDDAQIKLVQGIIASSEINGDI